MVTLPVIIFEPMAMLQKMAELMEYSYLLDLADKCEDPYLRLCKFDDFDPILCNMPTNGHGSLFNPILGETYEMVKHGGITFISELVSHHPPMSAGLAENEHFTYDITSKLKTKFLGNSLEVYPVGRKWNESTSYQPCDTEGEPHQGTELKEVWHVAVTPENDKFQYTYFAHKINSFDTAPKNLLASDSHLRPDRFAVERGDLSKAGAEKSSLEERQRAEKRTRKASGHQFTPRWFDLIDGVTVTPWVDLEIYSYNGKYPEHWATVDSSDSNGELDIMSIEFNPWQYGNLSNK
ncbi:hypothetical protein PVK06_003032 [Gossypium arboreum]|uniref:Uncharacterized protein n=1 Tax=Gossypium arboreum TaxID=29729 RepID=A0ABR0R572_GOSAR|nr:hypothetical protein PVK06_003032 [Gossypium arboreum]